MELHARFYPTKKAVKRVLNYRYHGSDPTENAS
jgi:hypothetical protein